jgi:amidase
MTRFTCRHLSDVLSRDVDFPYAVDQGEPVTLELADCHGYFPGADPPPPTLGANPVTGPLAIRGVVPGDTIAVEVQHIAPIGAGHLGQRGDPIEIPVDAESWTARLAPGFEVPLAPMVGTIGVAPGGPPVDTHRAGDHGGNMDCNIVQAGTTVCFNVSAPGAGLGLGDMHAVMGDGEVSGQGIECAAVVELRVHKVAGLSVRRPYGLRADRFFIVGWGSTLEEAADMAQADMVELLLRLTDLSEDMARRFLGIGTHLRVGWRGGATPTVWLEVSRAMLPTSAWDEITGGVGEPLG